VNCQLHAPIGSTYLEISSSNLLNRKLDGLQYVSDTFIYSLFKDTVGSSDHTTSKDKINESWIGKDIEERGRVLI
jgi:hypothetical protein